MTRAFRDALLDALETTKRALSEVSESAGVSYEQMKKVKSRPGASTNVDDARKVAEEFGYSLDEFLSADHIEDRIEIVRVYKSLSERERRLLKAAAAENPAPPPGEVPSRAADPERSP